jgi:tetratricopeptide (TPR) repeat protein
MMNPVESSRTVIGTIAFAVAIALWLTVGMSGACAATVGVLVAQVAEAPAPLEVSYADALVARAAEEDGLQAALLHEGSPLVTGREARLPAMDPGEDWGPLEPILSGLAAQLGLDYVLATAIIPAEGGATVQAMVAVRGGDAARMSFDVERDGATELAQSAAAEMVRRLTEAIAESLPAPRDPGDEAVPVPDDTQPDAPQPPADEPVPAEPVATPPADDAPVPPADEPEGQAPVVEDQPGPLSDAIAVFNRGDYKQALALINDAMARVGPSGEAYLLRARCYLALQDQDAAMSELQRAIDIAPELIEARLRLARLQARRGLWQMAAALYEEALDIAPDDREALLGLARLYRDNGHRQKAIDLLTGAEAASSDAGLLMLLGDLYALNSNDVEAQAAYLRAMALGDDPDAKAVALERLGDFYVKLHRHRDALTCYLQAAQLNPTRTSVVTRRYVEVMSAADRTVYDELTEAWVGFEAFVRDGSGEREIVYQRMAACRGHVQEAMRFADGITPPEEMRGVHARRQYAYSLAYEAAVTALSYLDLDGGEMRDRAMARCDEAIKELERLRGAP